MLLCFSRNEGEGRGDVDSKSTFKAFGMEISSFSTILEIL